MAFYLNNDGIGNARVDLSNTIFIGATVGDYIEFDIEANAGNSGGNYRIAAGYQDNFEALLEVGTTQVFFRPDNDDSLRFTTNYTQPPVGQRFTLRVERVAVDLWECFLDGNSLGTATSPQDFRVIQFGDFSISFNEAFQGKFYNVVASTDGGVSVTNNWNKQTLSGSNDTVFPDTVSGNDGTLINFPTDNSQWVFFDDGGGAVTVDGATTLPSLTATGNASATLPQPSLSASINLTQLSATGSASATLPNPQLDAAIAFNAFTATGNASVTLPQPDASGSIVFNAATVAGSATATLPQPTLQAAITLPVVTANGNASAALPGFNLSASVNIPTLTAAGEAQATLPQPVVSASVTMPSLTALGAAEATEPSFTVSGSVTLQPPTVTGSVSATLPQPSISGNIALPSIQASGFIIGGEVVITVELETNINEPQLSANINEPQLSTNINGPKLSTNITE